MHLVIVALFNHNGYVHLIYWQEREDKLKIEREAARALLEVLISILPCDVDVELVV